MSNEDLNADQAETEYVLTPTEEKVARKLANRVIKSANKRKLTAAVPLLNPIRGHLLYEQAKTVHGTGHSQEIFDRSRAIIGETHTDIDFTRYPDSGKVRVLSKNGPGSDRPR